MGSTLSEVAMSWTKTERKEKDSISKERRKTKKQQVEDKTYGGGQFR